jgi:hypothetical protein
MMVVELTITAQDFTTEELTEALRARGFMVLASNSGPPTSRVLAEVAAERARHDEKWGEQNHPIVVPISSGQRGALVNHCISTAAIARSYCDQRRRDGLGSFADILIEEVAEACDAGRADAIRGDGNEDATRAECVQVAAVAVAMVEAIDRRKAASVRAGVST